jgi:hypothetical protein
MISCAWGRSDIGSGARGAVPPSPKRALICGVSDEVAHVSITSRSGSKSVPPHDAHAVAGPRVVGSTGRSSSRATVGAPHALQCQSGNGTP